MQPVKGMPDIFGVELLLMNEATSAIKEIAELNVYSEVILPVVEYSEVFHRTLGDSSDIVNKETYTFNDRNNQSLTLRPEFTASVCRAVFSNKWQQQLPLRLFTIGSLFRYERPQKGRYRQFHQASFEFFGVSSVQADIEIILMATNILQKLQLSAITQLEINSIGGKESRGKYTKALKEYYSKYEEELSEDSKLRLLKNPLRILDSKDKQDIAINKGAPTLIEFLSSEELEHYNEFKNHLNQLNIEYIENPRLVRGLDYYNDIVFEITTQELGSQSAVVAGGRYDSLSQVMGKEQIPAVGFAIGIERLVELMKVVNYPIASAKTVYALPIGEKAEGSLPKIMNELRQMGVRCLFDYKNNVSKNMKKASNLGCEYVMFIGEDELKQNIYKLKNLASGEEKSLTINEIASILQE